MDLYGATIVLCDRITELEAQRNELINTCKTTLEILDAEICSAPVERDTEPEKIMARILRKAIKQSKGAGWLKDKEEERR